MKRFNRLVFAVATFAAAISAADTDAPAPAPAPPAPAQPAVPQLSAAEMKVQSAALHEQTTSQLQDIERLREMTKRQKDVIKLTCVNDRYVQAKAQANLVDDAQAQLTVAVDTNVETARGIFANLSESAASVKTLHEQAQACVGEPDLFKQESGVIVEKPEIPDDPLQDNSVFEPDVEPPGYASPYS